MTRPASLDVSGINPIFTGTLAQVPRSFLVRLPKGSLAWEEIAQAAATARRACRNGETG